LAGDRELATEAVLLQATALLELADPRTVARLEEFVLLATELHQAHFDYLAATRRVTLALVAGDVGAFDQRMEEAHALAQANDEPDVHHIEGVQLGGRDALVGHWPDSTEVMRRSGQRPAYEEMTVTSEALALIEQGDVERARGLVRGIDLEAMERRRVASYGWLWMLANLAMAAAKLGETDLLRSVERHLRPHASTCVVVAGAVSFLGSVSHYLGLIYAALDQPADATAAFEEALAAYDRLGARAWAEHTLEAMAALAAPEEATPVAALARHGHFWTLQYEGEQCQVKDTKGVRDLAVLLATPNREVPAAELMAQGMAAEAVGSGADNVLDERARAQFRQRLADLDADLADAEADNDLGRIATIKAERDAIAHELAAALGLGGRARTLGDPAERARKAVSARIRDAVKAIGSCHLELGAHLDASVRTGTFCCYAPATEVRWRVTEDTAR
jgi:tetratricopeptide (TPR) repeat protein